MKAAQIAFPVDLPVAKYLVTLEEPMIEVVASLGRMGDALGIFGIVGMGGIGKTTLGKSVYDQFAIRGTFDLAKLFKGCEGK